jgi:DNA-binding CsgD family transcriptional regulator/pimeloyl-ACP methyl ester carboxylesterase
MRDPLAARFMLVEYDARGTGSSTRGIGPDHSMLDTLIDLEAVADAANTTSFVLMADIFSCYTAMLFAIQYPERVRALILVNPSPLEGEPLMAAWRDLYLNSWPLFLSTFIATTCPDGEDVKEMVAGSVTQEDFKHIADGAIGHKMADIICLVTVPTLVLSSRSFLNPKFLKVAHEVAAGMANGRLVHLDGSKNADFLTSSDGSLPRGIRVIDEFLGELGLDADDPLVTSMNSDETGLSSREVEVLRLIAAGKRNREIARDLVISDSTVAKHVSSILSKTESGNRAEATTFAHTHHLV